MRRILTTFTCLAAFVAAAPATAYDTASVDNSYAAQSAMSDVPLVIIRFNQRTVMYERQLYNAIAKAVAIKPDVVLDIISFVPLTGNTQADERLKDNALAQSSKVVNSLRNMGIPQERMHVSREGSPEIRFHEIHVYVD
jgi:hypothetical protein